MAVHTCNPRLGKVEDQGSGIQGYSIYKRRYKTSIGYIRPHFKNVTAIKKKISKIKLKHHQK